MREWLFQQLLTIMGTDNVYQGSDVTTVPENKPFAVYVFGTTIPEIQDGNVTIAASSYVNIWVHDVPGDYQQIDTTLKQIRATLETADNTQVICAKFLSSSDDLRDPEMGTITRYSRFQLTHAEEA